MKATTYSNYGSPDVLILEDIEKPVPKDNEVLVKVHASALNSADIDYLRGHTLIRLGSPQKPAHRILGTDIAGIVEVVGKDVTDFRVGDEVYGDLTEAGFGAFAEYVAVPANTIALKPKNLSFIEAAAIPTAGIIALQGIRDYGNLQAGQRLLINGAGGGVGTLGIQLAHFYGAKVTAVDSADKFAMLQSLGVEQCIDYRREDYTRSGQQFDLVIDVIAKRTIFDYQRVLSPTGKFGMIGGSLPMILQAFTIGSWLSRGNQKLGLVMVFPKQENLNDLRQLIEAGHLRPIIHRVYPLADIAKAFAELEAGKACGKIVIQIQ